MSKATKKQAPRQRTWTGRDSFGPELNPTTSTPCEQSNSSPAVQEKHCKPTSPPTYRFSDGDVFIEPQPRGFMLVGGELVDDLIAAEYRRRGYVCATPDEIARKKRRGITKPNQRESRPAPFCSRHLAQFLAESNVPVISYLRFAFDRDCTLRFDPSKLVDESTVEAFYEHVDEQRRQVATLLTCDRSRCRSYCQRPGNRDEGRDDMEWLLPHAKLTPLFLYCVKRRFGFACSEQDLTDAISQYMDFPVAYDQTWQSALPPGFGETACKVYLGLDDPGFPESFRAWLDHKDPSEKHT